MEFVHPQHGLEGVLPLGIPAGSLEVSVPESRNVVGGAKVPGQAVGIDLSPND